MQFKRAVQDLDFCSFYFEGLSSRSAASTMMPDASLHDCTELSFNKRPNELCEAI